MIDVETPDSPGWWLKRCADKLAENRKQVEPLFERYEGRQKMPPEMSNAPDQAQRFYKTARTNLAELIVKSLRYRLKVNAILTANESGEGGDVAAWKGWKSAGMTVELPDAIRNMLVARSGYVMVQEYEGEVAGTSEDPRQVVTIHDPVRQSRIRAAAKIYHDDDFDVDYAYLMRPGRVWVAVNDRKGKTAPRFSSAWSWSEEHGGEQGVALPEGFEDVVPLVRLRNDENVSEFERHVDILNRFDHLVLQGMVIATMQAFKQRGIKASSQDMPERDPNTGQVIDYNEIFLADPGSLWKLPESADMWESGSVDTTPIVTMATKQLEQVSAVTFTPLSAFTPEGANQSATGASLVREGQVFKVEDKQERIGEACTRIASLIFRMAGTEVGDPSEIGVGWAPAQRYGLSEMADAWSKLDGVPWRTKMRTVMQMPPSEIEQAQGEREADAAFFAAQAREPAGADEEGASPVTTDGVDPKALKDTFDALGAAIRAGVTPESAARALGVDGVEFIPGATPVSLRVPTGD